MRQMAKKAQSGTSVNALKAALDAGDIGRLYLFFGEEAYLREHYLKRLRESIVAEDAHNLEILDGKACTPRALCDAIETYPLFTERKLVLVRDYDIVCADKAMAEAVCPLLEDLPAYICLVFLYRELVPGDGKKNKKIEDAIHAHGQRVEFARQSRAELVKWAKRRFQARGKRCGDAAAAALLDACGDLMYAAIPEIEKVAAYARGEEITQTDIDAVTMPVREVVIYRMTDAIASKNAAAAMSMLDILLKQGTEETAAIQVIGRAMRQLYAARIAADARMDTQEYMQMARIFNNYAAGQVMQQSRRYRIETLRDAVRRCHAAEQVMFTQADKRQVLETLVYELCLT